jgi:hypothetical protein
VVHRLPLNVLEHSIADIPLLEHPVPNWRHALRPRPENRLGFRIPDDRSERPGHVSPAIALTACSAR